MSNSTLSERVPFLDIARENDPLHDEIQAQIQAVCRSGAFVLGPPCVELEEELAQLSAVKYGIGCASGSDALLLALMAFDIQPGDEVIVPSFTFFATASAVWRLGAKPVFVDIEPDSFNLCPHAVARAVTPATKAIIPVHLFGQVADMPKINRIAQQHGIKVIEDAAQSIGASHQGRPAGRWGDISCISFYPTKNLGAFGDAGMLVTDDEELADKLRLLRVHGMRPRYYHHVVGINSRLDSIQAAVLNVKLKHLAGWSQQRAANAKRYQELFTDAGLTDLITVPQQNAADIHVWNQFTVRVKDGMRDSLKQYLSDRGVGCEVYYPVPLHEQTCFAANGYGTGSLPETEQAAKEVLSLPVFPQLTEAELQTVVHHVQGFFQSSASRLNDYRPAAA